MSAIKVVDARGINCPKCGKMFQTAVRLNCTTPAMKAGHRGICVNCEALLLIVEDGLLTKAVEEQESALPADIRAVLPRIKENNRRIREFHKMMDTFEGIL